MSFSPDFCDRIRPMKAHYGPFFKFSASVFYLGYIPFAPGTFGTLAATAYIWFFKPEEGLMIGILAFGFAFGAVSSHYAEKAFGEKDSRHIVIDEFIGYLFSVAFLPLTSGYLIAAFFLFRFFDILKPPPIRNLEKALTGGLGVMLDDVVAGIFTNVILQLWNRI